jgi:hypothetical protein
MTPPSDSTDKVGAPYKSHPDQHGHWDVQDIATLLHERDALQARYDALRKAGDGMANSLESIAEVKAGTAWWRWMPQEASRAIAAYRAATGEGNV